MPNTRKIYRLTILTHSGEELTVEKSLKATAIITDELAYIGINGFAWRPKGEVQGVYWPPAVLKKIMYEDVTQKKIDEVKKIS